MSDALVISGTITVGTPPTNAGWGLSPLQSSEVLKSARIAMLWRNLMEKRVSFRAAMGDIVDDAAAEDALRYSFIPVTPPSPKGPMPCQRSIDLL